MSNDRTWLTFESCEAGDDRGIVSEFSIAMDFREVFEKECDEVERVGPLRVSRHERFLPRRQVRVDFVGDFGKLQAELVDLRVACRLGLERGELFDPLAELKDRLLEL